jgi:hypothetical protein
MNCRRGTMIGIDEIDVLGLLAADPSSWPIPLSA